MGFLQKLPKFCDCSVKLYMQSYLLGHTTYLGSHVAMKNGRSNMAHLMAALYISNIQRSTISRNNNTAYFEPSIFVYVHVHFVIPLTNVWQLFTLRSNLSSKSLFSTYFGFRQLTFRYKKWPYLWNDTTNFNKDWRIFYSCSH